MWKQVEFSLMPHKRGFNLITDEINEHLPELPQTGILHLFLKHTSAALSINENVDPDLRIDMENIFNRIVPERAPYYQHMLEGIEDMPAHTKSTIVGNSLVIPITDGEINLGDWQGIYLFEFRHDVGPRKIVATINGE